MAVITISNLRRLNCAGVLAERDAKSDELSFLRYNLFYGYNGSGKSTLSRIFASLQFGVLSDKIPPECSFEFQLSNDSNLTSTANLSAISDHVLVFNSDFIERNLQWSEGHANPVFYIGQEQAEAAAQLSKVKTELDDANIETLSFGMELGAAEKQIATLKRTLAKNVAGSLRLRGRKYEANHWSKDFSELEFDTSSVLNSTQLAAAEATCRLEEPMAKMAELNGGLVDLEALVKSTRSVARQKISTAVISELEKHPSMVGWVKTGHDYHSRESLEHCLFCGNPITAMRNALLCKALDDGLERHLAAIENVINSLQSADGKLDQTSITLPDTSALDAGLSASYKSARAECSATIQAARTVLAKALAVLREKQAKPTLEASLTGLASDEEITSIAARLTTSVRRVNSIIGIHNKNAEDFANQQNAANLAIRKHYLAKHRDDYRISLSSLRSIEKKTESSNERVKILTMKVDQLESSIRKHGPAAERINKLIVAYLGHSELSIAAIDQGYQIQRYGNPIIGLPSEGEKTAIAISYFISTLEADGRTLKDQIVVIDDPISSLDTRALNYAATLLKSRLADAAQLFVLTHNHNFMNEFKKAWKSKYRPENGKDPTAAFYFLDVSIPKDKQTRSSMIVRMPSLLREYDSEYHFLFHYIIQFSKEFQPDYEYAYMLPHVLRRVLEIFLAFRCPGSAGLTSKIDQLCAAHQGLDKARIGALDRLTQVESHSDNLDDLVSFSPMALEETMEATKALLEMMTVVDPAHLSGVQRLCR